MYKPKALEAKIDELKYPALNEDPVSQTPWKQTVEQLHWVPSPMDPFADDSNLQKLSSVLKSLSPKWWCLSI